MAGISAREIKNRIRSMRSTLQITQAMELVSNAKLRRAQTQVISSRPYFEALQEAVHWVAESEQEVSSPYLTARPVEKTAWIVIAGDRGLAGAYNSNVLKIAWDEIDGNKAIVLPIGKKTVDFFQSCQCTLLTKQYAQADEIGVQDCFSIARQLCDAYLASEFDQVRLAYTSFVSILSQAPVTLQLLPLPNTKSTKNQRQDVILYEPNPAVVLDTMIPEYMGGILYNALCESHAAEHATRRMAMSSATDNANELIDALSLQYNRTRQAAITQRITEIVAGAQ